MRSSLETDNNMTKKQNPVERYHALGPVARQLDVSVPTLKKRCQELGIPLLALGGRTLRISDLDLARLLEGKVSA